MYDKINSLDLQNLDTFALEITKCYLQNVEHSTKSIEHETYAKLFISTYVIFKEVVSDLKSSEKTIDDIMLEVHRALTKD